MEWEFVGEVAASFDWQIIAVTNSELFRFSYTFNRELSENFFSVGYFRQRWTQFEVEGDWRVFYPKPILSETFDIIIPPLVKQYLGEENLRNIEFRRASTRSFDVPWTLRVERWTGTVFTPPFEPRPPFNLMVFGANDDWVTPSERTNIFASQGRLILANQRSGFMWLDMAGLSSNFPELPFRNSTIRVSWTGERNVVVDVGIYDFSTNDFLLDVNQFPLFVPFDQGQITADVLPGHTIALRYSSPGNATFDTFQYEEIGN